jgi:hypothetical protein
MRHFAGRKLGGPIPDEATILNFRPLLKDHDLADDILAQVKSCLLPEACFPSAAPSWTHISLGDGVLRISAVQTFFS